MATDKTYNYKIFDITGSSELNPVSIPNVIDAPSFNMKVNDGYGELRLRISSTLESYDSVYDFMNLVKVFEVDSVTPQGRLIYQGHIEEVNPFKIGSDEGVDLGLVGLNSHLDNAFYETSLTDPGVTFINVDPSEIYRAIIDNFRAGNSGTYGDLISYGDSTIEDAGVTVSLNFEGKTWKQAIDEAFKISGGGFYWFIDVNGVFHFQSRPTSATHTFTVGKDVEELIGRGNIKNIKNEATLEFGASTNGVGATYITAFGSTSIEAYGKRKLFFKDNRINSLATASNKVVGAIDNEKDLKQGARTVINSNFDNTSGVLPGDTAKFQNLGMSLRIFNDNMFITDVNYTRDRVTIQFEESLDSIESQLNALFDQRDRRRDEQLN